MLVWKCGYTRKKKDEKSRETTRPLWPPFSRIGLRSISQGPLRWIVSVRAKREKNHRYQELLLTLRRRLLHFSWKSRHLERPLIPVYTLSSNSPNDFGTKRLFLCYLRHISKQNSRAQSSKRKWQISHCSFARIFSLAIKKYSDNHIALIPRIFKTPLHFVRGWKSTQELYLPGKVQQELPKTFIARDENKEIASRQTRTENVQ